jgi:DNA polymerase III sliding clamp (beta) subunit (PCNA family)
MASLNCTLDRKGFKAALAHAARVTERRNTIPVLSHVRLEIGRDLVRLTATDLDIVLTGELPAATEGEGVLLLQLESLKAAVGKFAGESVRIEELHAGKASIACSSSGARMILPTLPGDDWPTMKRGDMLAEFWAPASAFAGAIATALPFASSEETRYYLMGTHIHATCEHPGPRTEEHEALCAERSELQSALADALDAAGPSEGRAPEAEAQLEIIRDRVTAEIAALDARIAPLEAERTKPDVFRFVTTDGHRMARVTIGIPEASQWRTGGPDSVPDVILPKKACKVLGAVVGKKPEGDMRVAMNGAKVELQSGRWTMLSKLIDGTFPDYTRVIPTQNDIALTVPADAFKVAVESVSAIATEKTRAVAVSISEREGVILCCSSPENGKAANIFEGGEISEGARLAIGFNAAYLGQFLDAFAGGDVTLKLADPAAPVAFTSPGRPELLAVLMPMRVDSVVTTRADVEALTASPWAAFKASAKGLPAAIEAIRAIEGTYGRKAGYAAIGKSMRDAIAYLVDQGEPRHIARLRVKAELAYAASDAEAGDQALRLIDAYQRQPSGSFMELARRGRDPARDLAPKMDPAETAEAEAAPIAADDGGDVNADPFDGFADESDFVDAPEAYVRASEADEGTAGPIWRARLPEELETVAAQAPVTPEPVAEQVTADVVKVLTLTDQAVFVAAADFADTGVAELARYNRDGSRMGERTILRVNIKRLVPARNRGDRPMPAAKAVAPNAANDDVAERLRRLERIIAGGVSAERPKRSQAHVRAIMAYLQARSLRVRLQRMIESVNVASRQWLEATEAQREAERKAAKLDSAIECRDIALADVERLRVRCDALERLHVASQPLDTAAAGKPAIILPVSRTSARAQ